MATGSGPSPLPQAHHYIRFSIAPPAPTRYLGTRTVIWRRASHTYLDVLWVADAGNECVCVPAVPHAASVMAAAAVFQGQHRFSTIRESPFLPAIPGLRTRESSFR
ncbi:hypothetical protein EI94DRAFT_1734128, partial [Lactarius quietus]